MSKEQMEQLYAYLTDSGINELYNYSCLLSSGFDKDTAYDLYSTLDEIWREDEQGYAVAVLSDALYEVYDDIKDDINDMTDSEILEKVYEVL